MQFRNLSMMVVEDDETIRKTLSEVFKRQGFRCLAFEKGRDALRCVEGMPVDMAILDLRLPDMDGLDVLKSIKEIDEDLPVVIMTAYPEIKIAISAMKAGAYDYINKPFELEELRLLVERIVENRYLKQKVLELQHQSGEEDNTSIVGESQGIKGIIALAKKVAGASKTPVLITGESGVGKELVAKAIHKMSSRADRPFIKVNCTAIPESLLESELFGYEKGAFTDAKTSKKGLFELANGGTIFLDEIGDLQPSIQPKLLHILETQTFRRVGGLRDITVDVRITTATNQDLKGRVEDGAFRQDLYYRLNVFTIPVPPLRERKEDILLLADVFLKRYAKTMGKEIKGFADDVIKHVLLSYSWPGNIRELKNLIERAVILSAGDEITLQHIPDELKNGGALKETNPNLPCINRESMSLESVVGEAEKTHIYNVLSSVKNNKSAAARLLGISRYTLREKIKRYGISLPDLNSNNVLTTKHND